MTTVKIALDVLYLHYSEIVIPYLSKVKSKKYTILQSVLLLIPIHAKLRNVNVNKTEGTKDGDIKVLMNRDPLPSGIV